MDELALQFFPFPHVFKGKRRPGLLRDWPTRCQSCDKQCETSRARGLQLCSYGLNFQRVDADLLVAGLPVSDYPANTPARRKMLQQLRGQHVQTTDVAAAVDRAQETTEDLARALQASRNEVIANYQASKGYQRDVLEMIRPQLQQQLSQVHDYKQFVQQVLQNLDVLLEQRFPDLPLDEKVESASHEERAIYWAAMLMDEKLDAALMLQDPSRIHATSRRFNLHGLVLKYVRIYQRQLDAKNVRLYVSGTSGAELEGNPRAISIIPHALLDNAIKYAPERTTINVSFDHEPGIVTFRVDSWGPRIRADEQDRIFDPFYRGAAAIERVVEGTGVGLAQAQLVAKEIGSLITVEQDDVPGRENSFRTRFRITFSMANGQSGRRSRG